MKVLFAVKALDGISGGAERVLCQVASGLVARGHDVSVLSYDREGGEAFYPLDVRVTRICLGIGDASAKATLGETLARMTVLRRTVRAEKPDVVLAFMHSMFVPAAFALVGSGVPVIASEHIVPAHYAQRRFEYFLLLLSSFFVRRITVLSDAVRQSYPAFLRPKMVAIANPVMSQEEIADPVGKDGERKVLLSVGRLDPQKDQATLIRAFQSLAKKFPDWDLRIVGEGPLRRELETLIQSLDIEDRVSLPGTTRNINTEYCSAQVFVLPSRYESFGLATAEAMAHGLPVIGFSDCSGTNELITDGVDGYLVSGEDRDVALSAALERLMRDADLRVSLGCAGRDSVARYSSDNVLDLWEKVLTGG